MVIVQEYAAGGDLLRYMYKCVCTRLVSFTAFAYVHLNWVLNWTWACLSAVCSS